MTRSCCVHVKSLQAVSDSLRPHGLEPTRLLYPWESPGKDTGVGCHFLLQGIFPTQGSNPCLLCLLQWQVGSLLQASHGKPPFYEWERQDHGFIEITPLICTSALWGQYPILYRPELPSGYPVWDGWSRGLLDRGGGEHPIYSLSSLRAHHQGSCNMMA